MDENAQLCGKGGDDSAWKHEEEKDEDERKHTPSPHSPFEPYLACSLQGADNKITFQNWLDLSPDALVIIDSAGLIRYVNRQMETLFGYSFQELENQQLEILLPERFRAAHIHHRERFAAAPRIRQMGVGLELYGLRKDGTEVPVDISLSPLCFGDVFSVLGAIRDITERRSLQESERAARAELELLQLILDELPISVSLIRGEQARLVLANRTALAIWGTQWHVGQPMQDFLTSNGLRLFSIDGHSLSPTTIAPLRAVRQGETVREHQELIQRADGTTTSLLVNAVALGQRLLRGVPAPNERSTSDSFNTAESIALVVHQDVTELMELERRKDEFIAMASHELRTPVTSIKTYVQWLRRRLIKQGDEASSAVLTKIDGELNGLTRLIGELLDITQMETGHLPWHEETFDLNELVREVAEALEHTTERHQIKREGQGSLPVYADRERICQVLANLLSNAIKYTPQGGTILVRQTKHKEGVTLSVQDSGIGIPHEKQTHLFERFYRVKDAEHENFPGLGLGLYLSAEIVKHHGGQIWVESEPGVGSTFFFTLPVRVDPLPVKGEGR